MFFLLTTMLVKSQTSKIYSVNYSDTTISKSIMELTDTCDYVYVVFSNKSFVKTIQKYFKENGINLVSNGYWVKFGDKTKDQSIIN